MHPFSEVWKIAYQFKITQCFTESNYTGSKLLCDNYIFRCLIDVQYCYSCLLFIPLPIIHLQKLTVIKREEFVLLSPMQITLGSEEFSNKPSSCQRHHTDTQKRVCPSREKAKQPMTYYNVLIWIYKRHFGFSYRKSFHTSKFFSGTWASPKPTKQTVTVVKFPLGCGARTPVMTARDLGQPEPPGSGGMFPRGGHMQTGKEKLVLMAPFNFCIYLSKLILWGIIKQLGFIFSFAKNFMKSHWSYGKSFFKKLIIIQRPHVFVFCSLYTNSQRKRKSFSPGLCARNFKKQVLA